MKYLFVSFFLLLLIFPASSFAQTPTLSASQSAQAVATTAATASVNYFLPYPGLLPGNLLYPLKMARDAVIGFLISDPLKKAKFDLLQSDKRAAAALALETRGDKNVVVQSTLSKAANYFEEAIGSTKVAKGEGMQINDMVNTLRLSNAKHQEVVRQIQAMLPQKKRGTLDHLLSRLQMLGRQVNELSPTR